MKRLLLLTLLLACRKEPPRVLPPEPQVVNRQPGVQTHVLAGQRLPDDAVVEALQTGAYCYPLPGLPRKGLELLDKKHLKFLEPTDDGQWQQVRLDLASGVTAVLLEEPAEEAPLPDELTPGEAVTPTTQRQPLPPNEVQKLTTLHDGREPWLVRQNPDGETLFEPTRAGPLEVVTLNSGPTPAGVNSGVHVQAAAKVPGGVIAALLRHDTDGDGQPSVDDEVDVCLIARAVQPVQVPSRQVPLHRLAIALGLRELVAQRLGEVTATHWRPREHLLELEVHMPACAMDSPEANLAMVGLADDITGLTEEAELSVGVRCVLTK